MLLHFDEQNFENEVAQGKTLVDFYADWCGPCQMLAPIIEEIASECDDVKVGKLNIDDARDIAIRYGVQSIPTLILFKDGEPVKTLVGYRPKDAILDILD
jgi:thioredoxin 1